MSNAGEVQRANVLDVKRAVTRKKRRRRQDHVHQELNITAMLDMMTIILVFLLKSLSASAGNVPQSDDLRLPRSTSQADPSGALQIIVSRVSITVNGHNLNLSLRNGLVDPSAKRGGGSGFLINPLNSEMRDQHEYALALSRASNQPFSGEMALIADSETPLRTIFEVLYTCGQNGFSNFQLLVLKTGAGQVRR
ncbi:MAG: biopolymer transporter ExbD [Deltaproteobacteria bacterium]|nr:biopolymer transporter ExbD [Deltaproteobacteria bacterium]